MSLQYHVDAGNVIDKCKDTAFSKGYEVFGVQFETECFTGPRAHLTYDMYGTSTGCANGRGGAMLNTVYRIMKGTEY